MIAPDLVKALEEFRQVRILMPESDGLSQGRDLVVKIQMDCPFPLVYVQRLGADPCVIVWRARDEDHAMGGFRVERYQA